MGFFERMVIRLLLVSALIPQSQVFASIGSVFPSTGFTAPIPGFPSATFPLLQYDSTAKDGKDATIEASDAKAGSITFSNLRNFSFQNRSKDPVEEDIEPAEVTEDPADFESTTTADVEPITNNYLHGRDEKSLIGTFPFIDHRRDAGNHHRQHGGHSQGNRKHHEHTHHDKGEIYGEHVALSNTVDLGQVKKFEVIHELAQQGGKEEVKDGRRCVNKVMMVEETEYDEVLTCDHSYDNRCHTSYVTRYEPVQEEDCEEKFKKTCYIEYEQKAYSETVQVCTTPWMKDCSEKVEEGEEFCQTVYQSECFTKQTVHEVEDDVPLCKTVEEEKCEEVKEGYTTSLKCDKWPREVCTLEKQQVKKYTPDTSCTKIPKQLCAPQSCNIVEGPVQCRDKVQTVVVDNPIEECDMEPIRTCKHVTKLVPRLVATQYCVDVPKEICARSKINPRRIRKPAIQKWCYTIDEGDGELVSEELPVSPLDCEDDSDCSPGYTCVAEEGKCRARPGKVLVKSITVRTASCTGCSSEGVVVNLEGERIGVPGGGLPAPVPCSTGILDRPGTIEFGDRQSSRWNGEVNEEVDDEELAMMGGCYEAPLNAMVRGGSLR